MYLSERQSLQYGLDHHAPQYEQNHPGRPPEGDPLTRPPPV